MKGAITAIGLLGFCLGVLCNMTIEKYKRTVAYEEEARRRYERKREDSIIAAVKLDLYKSLTYYHKQDSMIEVINRDVRRKFDSLTIKGK